MNIGIVERASARVAYLRYTGPLGEPLGRFWRGTVAPWLADHDLTDCPRYGVSVDDPTHTPPERFRYDACVELPPGLTLPDLDQTSIAGGTYAITRFRGTAVQIGPSWTSFIKRAIASGHQRDAARPLFEHYPRGAPYDHRTGAFACELCMPLGS